MIVQTVASHGAGASRLRALLRLLVAYCCETIIKQKYLVARRRQKYVAIHLLGLLMIQSGGRCRALICLIALERLVHLTAAAAVIIAVVQMLFIVQLNNVVLI